MELAQFVRDLLVMASAATAAVHFGFVAFSWFRRSVEAVR